MFYFLSAQNIFASDFSDQWQEINHQSMVSWTFSEQQITALAIQPVDDNFLITKSEFFPVTNDFN